MVEGKPTSDEILAAMNDRSALRDFLASFKGFFRVNHCFGCVYAYYLRRRFNTGAVLVDLSGAAMSYHGEYIGVDFDEKSFPHRLQKRLLDESRSDGEGSYPLSVEVVDRVIREMGE